MAATASDLFSLAAGYARGEASFDDLYSLALDLGPAAAAAGEGSVLAQFVGGVVEIEVDGRDDASQREAIAQLLLDAVAAAPPTGVTNVATVSEGTALNQSTAETVSRPMVAA